MEKIPIEAIPPAIQKAIAHIFTVQFGIKAEVRSLQMSFQNLQSRDIDCLSSLSLNSSKLAGSFSIGFPLKTILALINKMVGENYDKLTPENSDAASEILNIIYGTARKDINEKGFDFEPSIPTTVIGKNLAISKTAANGPTLFFDCFSEMGLFVAMVTLRTKTQSPS